MKQHDHASDIRSFVLDWSEPVDWVAFGIWLTALLHAHGTKILRVKGVIWPQCASGPVAIHGVQHIMHAPMHLSDWPGGCHSQVVFIVQGLEPAALEDSLQIFLQLAKGPADQASPYFQGIR